MLELCQQPRGSESFRAAILVRCDNDLWRTRRSGWVCGWVGCDNMLVSDRCGGSHSHSSSDGGGDQRPALLMGTTLPSRCINRQERAGIHTAGGFYWGHGNDG